MFKKVKINQKSYFLEEKIKKKEQHKSKARLIKYSQNYLIFFMAKNLGFFKILNPKT